jgi:peptide deformylase
MLETMYAAPGIGLAATQVNVQKTSRGHGCVRGQEPATGVY